MANSGFSSLVAPLTWREWLWNELRETANPTTMHTEDLTPAELEKQASFESLDYYKPYPDVYTEYLRERHRCRATTAAAHAAGYGGEEDADDGIRALPSHSGQYAPVSSQLRSVPAAAAGDPEAPSASSTSNAARSSGYRPVTSSTLTVTGVREDDEERHVTVRWFLHVLIAISVGVVATVVSYAVEVVERYRTNMLGMIVEGAPFRVIGYVVGLFFWVAMSLLLLAVATGVVVYFEPAAAGGGIPDVMAYLNGVHMRKAMNFRTFVAKAVSCVCAVAGGLPVGLEAPLIHLGAITGAGVTQGRSRTLGFQTSLFQAFRNNKDRRDFITAGAACGVSAAFGAPIGGLLFVMEEVCSFWDQSASGQIFLATMICFTVTTIINSVVEDRRLLGWVSNTASVLFEVNLTIPLNLFSIVPSIFLGALLGAIAAFFTKVNLILIKWRRVHLRPYPVRQFLEPLVIVFVYSTLTYTLSVLSECRTIKPLEDVNETIHVWGTEGQARLFNMTCSHEDTYSPFGTLNMASGKNVIRHLFSRQTAAEFPAYYLFFFFITYFVFACWSSGAAVSGGLVVPSLVIGAIFGRLYGLLLFDVGVKDVGVERGYAYGDAWMDPGVFALIGAGAFLAGTSRMTMSICVIMVELSSELHYLLPVMVAIVMSKTVADWLSEPLYHQMLHLNSVPYLAADLLLPEFEQLTAADVMARDVVMLRAKERTEVVLRALRETTHHAFPIVEAFEDDEEEDEARAGDDADGHTAERAAASSQASPLHSGDSGRHALAPVHVPALLDTTGVTTSGVIEERGLLMSVNDWKPAAATAAAAAAATTHSPHVAGVKRRIRYKFVGLVTREDVQVYFTLPQLQAFRPLSSEEEVAVNEEPVPLSAPDSDGFGGRLAPCVQAINHMNWLQWLSHKTSLFFTTADRYNWVRTNVPTATPPPTPSSSATSRARAATPPGEQLRPTLAPTYAEVGHGVSLSTDSGTAQPALPPVVDLSLIVNRSPWVIPPFFNIQMAYHTFRQMGLRHMVVVDGDEVRGIITRKDLLVDSLRRRMKELRARLELADEEAAELDERSQQSSRFSTHSGTPQRPPPRPSQHSSFDQATAARPPLSPSHSSQPPSFTSRLRGTVVPRGRRSPLPSFIGSTTTTPSPSPFAPVPRLPLTSSGFTAGVPGRAAASHTPGQTVVVMETGGPTGSPSTSFSGGVIATGGSRRASDAVLVNSLQRIGGESTSTAGDGREHEEGAFTSPTAAATATTMTGSALSPLRRDELLSSTLPPTSLEGMTEEGESPLHDGGGHLTSATYGLRSLPPSVALPPPPRDTRTNSQVLHALFTQDGSSGAYTATADSFPFLQPAQGPPPPAVAACAPPPNTFTAFATSSSSLPLQTELLHGGFDALGANGGRAVSATAASSTPQSASPNSFVLDSHHNDGTDEH